jgi:hypothetical protein
MSENIPATKGRPLVNKIGRIPASPEDIAKAIFRGADKKIKAPKPKPN